MGTKNISFKIAEEDYETIKKSAKEKHQKNLKGYIIWIAKQDMKQSNFEIANDDTHVEQIKKCKI